jgi:signal transduction histidine kinase
VTAFVSFSLILLGGLSFVLSIFNIAVVQLEENMHLILWQSGLILLALSGILLMLIKQPQHWGLGVLILILLTTGNLLQLESGTPSLLMGSVRLMQIVSFPWLITLVERFADKKGKEVTFEPFPAPTPKKQTKDTKPELINLLLKISLTETSDEKYKAVARALSLSVVSDICYLIQLPEESKTLQILAGYDLIREEFLKPGNLTHHQLPRLIDAWMEKDPLHLNHASAEIQDIATLISLLKYPRVGSLFAYPLNFPDQPVIGGVIFLSPYTNKQWGEASIRQMDEIKETLTEVLFSKDPKVKMQAKIDELHQEINKLKKQKRQLLESLEENELRISKTNAALKQMKAKYQKEKLEAVKKIDEMKEHIQELSRQKAVQNEQSQKLEQTTRELRQLIDEREQMKTALSQANTRIKALESQSGQTGPIRLAAEKQIISLDSIVANIKLQINPQLRDKSLHLEIINPNGRQMIKSDPDMLQAILEGLLDNAVQASESGGKIQLNLEMSYETGMLILQVTDYGQGLTQEEQKDLFRADHESIPGIGSMEALRNAVRAIRALNGKIWLRSKKGTLTTFQVKLPVRIID